MARAAGAATRLNFTPTDEAHMQRALALAEQGLWTTKPNPRVGCVIAHGETIVGEGWHARAGEPHAEVLALRDAGERARGATAYVTLEPCSHHGRTPPCADALIAAGIARVIAAIQDPNPKVAGGGLARLRENGIEVACDLLREQARALNAGFFSRMERGRPWVRVKIASSVDGRTALANGESKWITGPAARADVQRWRAQSSAILTGIGTVLADDPRLTARPEHANRAGQAVEFVAPLRVVLDSDLRTPAGAHVLDGEAPTLVVHARDAQPADRRFDRVERVAFDVVDGGLDLAAVLAALAAREVNELQVEAGPILVGSLLRSGFVDELLLYMAPIILGDTARPMVAMQGLSTLKDAASMTLIEQRAFGPDIRLRLLTGNDDVHGNH
jgi:diaminohydroxyphosphoribosylaminopyrimidine deaminase/5-amino-6-(5-phosphoribosylamino)uracil reductase